MTANEYREHWGILKHVALASAEYLQNCRDSVISRIRRNALRRMNARNKSGETVLSIFEGLQLSVSCLYRWLVWDKSAKR